MQREIIPAIGCTEPISVALCTARAAEILEEEPQKITAYLSANVLKNAMGVGIPGTGMIGLPIAIALGALIGNPKDKLEVLKNITPEEVEKGKIFIDERRIEIKLKDGIKDKLYIEIHCQGNNNTSTAVIRNNHTFFSFISKNGVILENHSVTSISESEEDVKLTFKGIYDYAIDSPISELEFILEAAEMNRCASIASGNSSFGHNVSKNITSALGKKLFGNNVHSSMVAATAGACDVRMAGAMIPVMSNTRCGNQGIAATLPVLTYAEKNNCSREQLIRALILSNLTMIYIKQHLGRLSALCGCVIASTGASSGITYLMGGNYQQITYATKNMIANITGMICDGAKPGCALKIASGVSTATLSALMAMGNEVVTAQEGIIDNNVDVTVQNLARVALEGMPETDKVVLDIMINK